MLHIANSHIVSGFHTVGEKLHDIHPHQTAHTPECTMRERRLDIFGDGDQPGPPPFRHPIAMPAFTGPEPSTSGSSSFSFRVSIFLGSIQPPSSVTRRGSSECMLVIWSLSDHMHASYLRPWCNIPRRHTSFPTPVSVLRTLQYIAPPKDHLFRWTTWPPSFSVMLQFLVRCRRRYRLRPLAITVSLSGLMWALVVDHRVSRTGVEDPPWAFSSSCARPPNKSVPAPPHVGFQR